MRRSLLALAVLFLLSATASAQPIARPFPFDIVPLDTNSSEYLDALVSPARELTAADRIKLGADGHLVDQANNRVRLFGTSLMYTSQFLPQDDAKMLAVRLRKLGFNAVRFIYNDFFGWDDASLIKTYTDDWSAVRPSSYDINPAQLARFDTLLYELKRNGLYSVITFNASHNYSYGDGVRNWDSTFSGGGLHHFWDTTAQRLQMQYAARLMTHVNPLTGIPLASDPMIAYVSFNHEQSLYYWWQANRLNYIDEANKLTVGAATIAYHDSKRLDTLFNRYLQKKYGSQNGLATAWGGDQNPPKTNLIDNASFEDFGSVAWTFAASNGATAGQVEGDGGVDSSVFAKIRINKLSTSPVYNDIVLYNISPRLGMDTLYELTFWAKMGYDAVKRPGIYQRSLGVLVFSYGTNAIGLNASDVIDTAWKKYSFTFRATGSGVHYVYLYFGTDLGDVWLDAFDLHRKAETALLPNEALSTFKVGRLLQTELPTAPRQRTRDMVMFYDSLERTFYQSMQKHLKNNGYAGLVNWTQTQWYSMLPDIYKASGGDIAEHHTGWDYVSQRPNMPWSDSTWMVRNYSMVKSTSGGTLNNISANLVAGKANILGDYQVPWMNQYNTEQLVLLPALASYQDMDGIFFTPFAVFREDLRATKLPNQFLSEGGFNAIAKNPAILSLLPSASYAFRNGAIKAASVDDTLLHDNDDVWLYPVKGSGRGYHGVEGYLDPNAATAFRMRQAFGSKMHKVAAEYPYLSDTSIKKFDQDQIVWDQTNGLFTVRSPQFIAGTGFLGPDLEQSNFITMERTDEANDLLSYYLIQIDTNKSHRQKTYLLSLSTRAQNSGLQWASDSLSFKKDFGTAPTVMSASKTRFIFPTLDSSGVMIVAVQPLDSVGNPLGDGFEGVEEFDRTARITIDQAVHKTPWFSIFTYTTYPQSVNSTNDGQQITISPNPAGNSVNLHSQIPIRSTTICNALGQVVAHSDGDVPKLDVSFLTAGAYTLIIETSKGKKILPLRKL
jgi:hypothetical protein